MGVCSGDGQVDTPDQPQVTVLSHSAHAQQCSICRYNSEGELEIITGRIIPGEKKNVRSTKPNQPSKYTVSAEGLRMAKVSEFNILGSDEGSDQRA